MSKNMVWDIQVEKKDIYLTFDDGPIPKLTDYILDVLKDFDSKGTFFCVGENISNHPQLCENIVKQNHLLANHTFNHLKGWSTKNNQYLLNIEKCQKKISEFQETSNKPLFRPPHGQITKHQIKKLKDKYNIVMWDILSYDFETSHSPEKSLHKIIQKTTAGSIVIFHDNYKAEEKLKYMLPKYLEHFCDQGFIFKKLDLH